MEQFLRYLGLHYNQVSGKFEYEDGKEVIEVVRGRHSELWRSEPRIIMLVKGYHKIYEIDKRRAEIAWGVKKG